MIHFMSFQNSSSLCDWIIFWKNRVSPLGTLLRAFIGRTSPWCGCISYFRMCSGKLSWKFLLRCRHSTETKTMDDGTLHSTELHHKIFLLSLKKESYSRGLMGMNAAIIFIGVLEFIAPQMHSSVITMVMIWIWRMTPIPPLQRCFYARCSVVELAHV